MNVPEAEHERLGPRLQEATHETHQFVTSRHDRQTGSATAQGNELRRKLELIKVVQAQIGIAHLDSGEHRIILAKKSMRGDVNESCVRAVLTEILDAGVFSKKKLAVGERIDHCSGLLGDVWRLRIRHSKN